jgi:hypothetical protein
MSAPAQPQPQPRFGQCLNPDAEDFFGTEYDHDWWLIDAARIAREAAWHELDPQHVEHLLGELANLQALIQREEVLDALDPPF